MRCSIFVACAFAIGTAPAHADDENSEADGLFFEGRHLLELGRHEEACAKFDLSFRKNPRALGTLLNLGLCAETTNRPATAIRYFGEARDRAVDQKLAEYQEAAERKIALLSPRVPHLAIELVERIPSLRVIVDDVVLTDTQYADFMVDPGKRTIIVTAPGRLPYETTIEIAEAAHRKVVVPKLEGNRTVVVRTSPSNRRLWGKVGVGLGAGLMLAGVGIGWYARHAYWAEFPDASQDGVAARDNQHNCWTAFETTLVRRCNGDGSNRLSTTRTIGHVGTGTVIGGTLTIATGLYLWLTHRSDQVTTTLSLSTIGADHVGVAVSGSY